MGQLKGEFNLGKNLQRTIYELKIGEGAYTEPENLEIDYSSNLYLNLEGIIISEQDDNFSLYVKRIGKNNNDYLIDIGNVKNYVWSRTDSPFGQDINYIFDENFEGKITRVFDIWKDLEVREKRLNRNIEPTIKVLEEKKQRAIDVEDYREASRIQKQINRKFRK